MTEKGIQIAVAQVDAFICRARASPWWIFAAGVIAGGIVYIAEKRGKRKWRR